MICKEKYSFLYISEKVSLENIHHAKVKTESILLADYLTDIGEKIGVNVNLNFRVGYRF